MMPSETTPLLGKAKSLLARHPKTFGLVIAALLLVVTVLIIIGTSSKHHLYHSIDHNSSSSGLEKVKYAKDSAWHAIDQDSAMIYRFNSYYRSSRNGINLSLNCNKDKGIVCDKNNQGCSEWWYEGEITLSDEECKVIYGSACFEKGGPVGFTSEILCWATPDNKYLDSFG